MESISKLVRIRKDAKVSKVEHAIIVGGSANYVKKRTDENLRGSDSADGKIKGLSRGALSRLRDAIARTAHQCGDYTVYGCCLTIPWGSSDPSDPSNPTQSEAAEIWREWVHHIDRVLDFLDVGIIYRVELQERKAVHWHLMVFIPNNADPERFEEVNARFIDYRRRHPGLMNQMSTVPKKTRGVGRGKSMLEVASGDCEALHAATMRLLRSTWIVANVRVWERLKAQSDADAPVRLSRGCVARPTVPAAVKTFGYCFDSIVLNGVKSGVAYLASHTTKHKQDQLGYTGKQWGYLGRRHLAQSPEMVLDADMSHSVRARAFRLIRKWVKRNRTKSDYRVCVPRRVALENGNFIYTGLVIRNIRQIYLFGTPSEVVSLAFQSALLGSV